MDIYRVESNAGPEPGHERTVRWFAKRTDARAAYEECAAVWPNTYLDKITVKPSRDALIFLVCDAGAAERNLLFAIPFLSVSTMAFAIGGTDRRPSV